MSFGANSLTENTSVENTSTQDVAVENVLVENVSTQDVLVEDVSVRNTSLSRMPKNSKPFIKWTESERSKKYKIAYSGYNILYFGKAE